MPPRKKMEIMVPEKPMTRKEFITALETFMFLNLQDSLRLGECM
jgi:hypothetical protein